MWGERPEGRLRMGKRREVYKCSLTKIEVTTEANKEKRRSVIERRKTLRHNVLQM